MEEKDTRRFTLEREEDKEHNCRSIWRDMPQGCLPYTGRIFARCDMEGQYYQEQHAELSAKGWRVTHIDGNECERCEECGYPLDFADQKVSCEDGVVLCMTCGKEE